MTMEPLAGRIWRQAKEGIDRDRLLPPTKKRRRELNKKLDKPLPENGWRKFVSGQAWAITRGKSKQAKNAEIQLVETIQRWGREVAELAPERAADFIAVVNAGLANPQPLPGPEK